MLCQHSLSRHLRCPCVSVSVCVHLYVTFVDSVKTNTVKTSSNFFHHRVATPFFQLYYAMLHRKLAIGGVSVRSSHTDNASKLMTAGSCGFYHCAAHRLLSTFMPCRSERNPLRGLHTRLGRVKRAKTQISARHISVTTEHIVTMED